MCMMNSEAREWEDCIRESLADESFFQDESFSDRIPFPFSGKNILKALSL